MNRFLHMTIKFVAYTAAGIVILLAIAVGLFRLFLPRLPEYQEEIKTWASTAIGMQVEFRGMDARWGLSGPELRFYGAELIRPSDATRALAAEEVGVGVSLMRLMADRTLVVDTVSVRESSVEIRQLEDGSWRIQGTPADELLNVHTRPATGALGSIEFVGEDIELQLIHPGDERPTFIDLESLVVQRDERRIAVDADLQLEEDIGRRVRVSATRIIPAPGETSPWNISLDTNELSLAALEEIYPDSPRSFGGGSGDVDLSLALLGRRVVSASAEVEFEDVALGGGPVFDVSGRFAWNLDVNGWLLAADDLQLASPNGSWPEAQLRLETSTDRERAIVMLDAQASFINLADYELVLPWLTADQQQMLDALRPDGIVRNLNATLSNLDTETPEYTIAVEIDRVGVASVGDRPGLRGLSGSLRANDEGGLLEIESEYLVARMPAWLDDAVEIDLLDGTVIWRRSDERLVIISDSIEVATPIFDSRTNLEITFDGDGAPFLDLSSSWSVSDIGAVRRLLPEPLMRPRQYRWYQEALLSGRAERGEARVYGPLDAFPFEDDEGRFEIEATIRDADFRYNRRFPVTRVTEAVIRLENTRLYTERNRTSTLGNATTDAKVEIPNLRDPILRLQSFTTGTLESLHDFASNSPIAQIFGGNLDRVTVSGDATVALDLTVPIRNWRDFEFTSRLQTSNGTLAIDSVPAPLTEIAGAVDIERELVSSESLGGRYLGRPVELVLRNAGADMPGYRSVASMSGIASAEGLVEELGVPLQGRLSGETAYRLDVMFPRGNFDNLVEPIQHPGAATEPPADTPEKQPLAVRVSSDLGGLAVDLPYPYGKDAEDVRNVRGEARFLPGGERIHVAGNADDDFAWDLAFAKLDEVWDFDRGMLVLGDHEMSEPEVRGLHIRGMAPVIDLSEWLALSRGGAPGGGAASRIRSIDLEIADLFLLGQHLRDHRVRVDRSARDWLVQFGGEQVSGSVFVPYEFTADREIVLDMERLVMPGDERETGSGEPDTLLPTALPSIVVRAEEFAIGNRFLGAIEARFERTPEGLQADNIIARDASFEIVGNGRWVLDPADPLGSRSYITATLTSSNVAATMSRLDYEPGIISDDMGVLFDMNWSGGPRLDFFDTLDGEVQVRLGTGQLIEVDPGAGRMFGLMSFTALPRRLSFDFRDVFQQGFGFDEINGTFVVYDGVATTCDLSMSGPAAEIGIIGGVDLAERDYDQAVVVSGNFGDSLPVITAVAAGPQAAAVVFLFSQIFKKPLQEMGQYYYTVQGSWDEPAIESTDADTFAASGSMAGCLTDSE